MHIYTQTKYSLVFNFYKANKLNLGRISNSLKYSNSDFFKRKVFLYWTFKLNNHRYKISQLRLNWKPKRNLSDSLIYQNSFNIASITNTRVSQWFKIALYTLKLWFTLFPYLNSKLFWGLFIQHLLIFEAEAQDLRHAFLG